ncbi:MAG: hypothetical protein JXB35_09755 [Anaerolineae bacterium]|nr:hypothetical protein [Anaerolineae bacterium]
MDSPTINWSLIGAAALITGAGSLLLSVILLLLTYRSLKKIAVPPQADFFTTLRHVPISLVLILDLLDLALDFFAAPVGWIILGQLGLESLRGVTVIESLIPGTQFLPTLTAAWILARLGVRLPDPRTYQIREQ